MLNTHGDATLSLNSNLILMLRIDLTLTLTLTRTLTLTLADTCPSEYPHRTQYKEHKGKKLCYKKLSYANVSE